MCSTQHSHFSWHPFELRKTVIVSKQLIHQTLGQRGAGSTQQNRLKLYVWHVPQKTHRCPSGTNLRIDSVCLWDDSWLFAGTNVSVYLAPAMWDLKMECKNWFVSVIRITVEACPFISLKQLVCVRVCVRVWIRTRQWLRKSSFPFHFFPPFPPRSSKQLMV